MAASESETWYCVLDGSTSGPFSRDELTFLAARKRLSPDSRVRRGAQGDWLPAGSIEFLFPPSGKERSPRRPSPGQVAKSGHRPRTVEPAEQPTEPAAADPPASTEVAENAAEPAPTLPPPLPPHSADDARRKRLLTGAGIGIAAVLLILLLLLFLWPPRLRPNLGGGAAGEENVAAHESSPAGSADGSASEADEHSGSSASAGNGAQAADGTQGSDEAENPAAPGDPDEPAADEHPPAGGDDVAADGDPSSAPRVVTVEPLSAGEADENELVSRISRRPSGRSAAPARGEDGSSGRDSGSRRSGGGRGGSHVGRFFGVKVRGDIALVCDISGSMSDDFPVLYKELREHFPKNTPLILVPGCVFRPPDPSAAPPQKMVDLGRRIPYVPPEFAEDPHVYLATNTTDAIIFAVEELKRDTVMFNNDLQDGGSESAITALEELRKKRRFTLSGRSLNCEAPPCLLEFIEASKGEFKLDPIRRAPSPAVPWGP